MNDETIIKKINVKKGTHKNHRSRHQARLAQQTHSMLIKLNEGRDIIGLIREFKNEKYI